MTPSSKPNPLDMPSKMLRTQGMRDQMKRITYLPWADFEMSLLGFQVVPDGGRSVIVYFVPNVEEIGIGEIRCHATSSHPDPENDPLLSTIVIPKGMLQDDEDH